MKHGQGVLLALMLVGAPLAAQKTESDERFSAKAWTGTITVKLQVDETHQEGGSPFPVTLNRTVTYRVRLAQGSEGPGANLVTWVNVPGAGTAECVETDKASYLNDRGEVEQTQTDTANESVQLAPGAVGLRLDRTSNSFSFWFKNVDVTMTLNSSFDGIRTNTYSCPGFVVPRGDGMLLVERNPLPAKSLELRNGKSLPVRAFPPMTGDSRPYTARVSWDLSPVTEVPKVKAGPDPYDWGSLAMEGNPRVRETTLYDSVRGSGYFYPHEVSAATRDHEPKFPELDLEFNEDRNEWTITSMRIHWMIAIMNPSAGGYPAAGENVLDDTELKAYRVPRVPPDDPAGKGHYNLVAKNLRLYGRDPNWVTQMQWTVPGATQAHEARHFALYRQWFEGESGILKDLVEYLESGLKDKSVTAETIHAKAKDQLRELVQKSQPPNTDGIVHPAIGVEFYDPAAQRILEHFQGP